MQGLGRRSKHLSTRLLIYLSTRHSLNQVNQFVQFTKSIKMNLIMQNKPNLRNDQINANSYPTRPYKNLPLHGRGKNKPKQTQFKAIFDPSAPPQSQFKPNSNPNKPKQTQSEPNFRPKNAYKKPKNLPPLVHLTHFN